MPEPVTVAVLAISGLTWVASKAAEKGVEILGGVAGNVSDRVLSEALQGTRDRIAGLRGLPENHDVARSIRIAQMQALERVIRDYREHTGRRRWFESTAAAAFFERSLDFCARTVGRCLDPSVVLNLEITPALLDSVDGLLAPPSQEGPVSVQAAALAPPPTHEGSARDRAAALAQHAEETVLKELRSVLGDVGMPDAFTAHFRHGSGSRPRFLELFGSYVSEQIKTNARFRDIFFAGQLSRLTTLAHSTDESVKPLADQIDTLFRDYRLGDLVVQGRSEAYLTLTRHPGRAKLVNSELRLLDPFTRSIPLIGRDMEMAELLSWLRGDARVSVRAMTGPAGSGKTRLALEACDRIEGEGWDVGFVTAVELTRFRGEVNAAQWEWEKPTLIIVDYAAALAPLLHSWFTELADHTGYEKRPLRLLLLERHADPQSGWWETIVGRGWDADAVRALFDPPRPVTLPALVATETRHAVFTAMQDRLGAHVGIPPSSNRAFADQLARVSWGGEPLFLMMAALTARQSGVATALALTRTDAARKIADHELSRIERLRPSAAPSTSHRFIAHLAAYVTLRQGLPLAEALDVVTEEQAALRRPGAGDPPEVLAWLSEALPGERGTIAPILPDIVGEAVVLQAIGEGQSQAAVDAVARCAQHAWIPVVASTTRIAQDYAPAWHAPATQLHPAIVWLDRLAGQAVDDQDRLESLLDQMPSSTLTLRERTLAWTLRLVSLRRAAAVDNRERERLASALNNLSNRLSDLGQWETALAANDEAVGIYQELAAARPDAFRPDLAMALHNLSNRLSHLGQREAALAPSEEAVGIYRELAAARPDTFWSDLAMALNNLSIRLSHLGQREAALAPIEEAVGIYRELAAARPDAFRPDLATALNTLSLRLSDLGQREVALTASEEAVGIYRELAAARPDAFRPDLAMALNNLSNQLSDLGRREAALAPIEEAVGIYQELAAARPDTFRSDLATALNTLSLRLSDLGQREVALTASEGAVGIYRELAAARPDAFRPDLAMALNNLSNRLSDLGRREAALAPIEEAVGIYQELAVARPDAFRPDLATALNNLSHRQSDLGQREVALTASEGAVGIYRELAAARPDAFRPNLAMALNNLSNRLSHLGQREAALAPIEEAVGIYRELAAARPDAFRPNLALALHNMSHRQSDFERWEAGIKASEEASTVLRPQFLRTARPFATLMQAIIRQYLALIEQIGRQPDMVLLAPIIEAFERLRNETD